MIFLLLIRLLQVEKAIVCTCLHEPVSSSVEADSKGESMKTANEGTWFSLSLCPHMHACVSIKSVRGFFIPYFSSPLFSFSLFFPAYKCSKSTCQRSVWLLVPAHPWWKKEKKSLSLTHTHALTLLLLFTMLAVERKILELLPPLPPLLLTNMFLQKRK